MTQQTKDVIYYLLVGLGLGLNGLVWTGYLLMKWTGPKTRKFDGRGIV